MKERPIPFNNDMVRAILEGRKTQTRRPIKPQPHNDYQLSHIGNGNTYNHPIWSAMFYLPNSTFSQSIKCPYGQPGDRLWVKETWWHYKSSEIEQAFLRGCTVTNLGGYGSRPNWNPEFDPAQYGIWKKRPSRFMPRWASRITLEIDEVRVERIQDISKDDLLAEGAETDEFLETQEWAYSVAPPGSYIPTLRDYFAYNIWDKCYRKSENGPLRYDANPWVWVVNFRQVGGD